MTKHLSGSKRLAVIQRWINGHDDPDWEVLPTRKEGKYIVKKRETPIEKVEKVEETQEVEEIPTEPEEVPEPVQKPVKVKPKAPKPPKNTETQNYDPTINLEILNQLKLLGEEMKTKREKKEQKRMIKEVVNKQIRKPRNYYPQEQLYIQQPSHVEEEQPAIEPQQQEIETPKIYRRRNRIFDDII